MVADREMTGLGQRAARAARVLRWVARDPRAWVLGGLLAACVIGCASAPPADLPAPASGKFLTLEEQRALSPTQLSEYCRMLDAHLDTLRHEVGLARRMSDSLSAVLDTLNARQDDLNREMQSMQQTVQRAKSGRKGQTTYIVQEGDRLEKLSELFYGTSSEWLKIYQANRPQIEDPTAPLKAGLKLVIPPQ